MLDEVSPKCPHSPRCFTVARDINFDGGSPASLVVVVSAADVGVEPDIRHVEMGDWPGNKHTANGVLEVDHEQVRVEFWRVGVFYPSLVSARVQSSQRKLVNSLVKVTLV